MSLGEHGAPVDEREQVSLVPGDQVRIGQFVEARAPELHAVLLGEPLDLAVPEHRQAGQGGQHGRHAEVLVPRAELLDGRGLVGVAHEVHVALEDVRVERERVPDDLSIAGVVLVPEHVHERAVVDAMHAQGSDEVALEEPERLRQQERVGDLGRHSIHHFAPELGRHQAVELRLAQRVLGA